MVSKDTFLTNLIITTDYIVEKEFKYGYLSDADRWTKAKQYKRVTCATMVSLVLQRSGILKPRQMIWSTESGNLGYIAHGSYSNSDVKKRIKTYFNKKSPQKKWKKWKKKAQIGDIIIWKNHISVYSGKNKEGKDVWFDAGRNATYSVKIGSKFKDCHKVMNMDNKKVYYVLRLKEKYNNL